jgi:osmotically inducible protein OsmC
MKRSATAEWKGGLKDGKGAISSDSGVLKDARYGFTTRFEGEAGTNPEELIAAAHAGCFSMALSGQLDAAGLKSESIKTKATVSLDKLDAGWTVTAVHLETRVKLPADAAEKFRGAADKAKAGCPISRLLAPAAKITLDAQLVS